MPRNQVRAPFVERWFTFSGYVSETSPGVSFCLLPVPGRTPPCFPLSGQLSRVCAGVPRVVRARICGDRLLFPGLCLAEARVYLCLQLLALVASPLQERLMNK